ncbi:multidrug resistance protein 1-like [Sergentomyia squamirostris]
MRLRMMFFKAILKQDITWFDFSSGLDFSTKIRNNFDLINDAIGEKFIMAVFNISAFLIHLIVGIINGWKLALITGGTFSITLIGFSIYTGVLVARYSAKEVESYSVAGSIAEEVYSGIKTVVAFGGEDKEVKRYKDSLRGAEMSIRKKNLFLGLQSGIFWFMGNFDYSLSVVISAYILKDDEDYNVINTLTTIFCLLMGSAYLTYALPSLEAIASAVGALKSIYGVIDAKSGIDPFNESGIKLNDFRGDIEFRNVHFEYPTRKTFKVLNGVNLDVKKGQTIALVGQSGCGKSTCIQLLQRLYDVTEGDILIDGINIKDFNISFLRSQIGVVGQEPHLFSTTIMENIRFGYPAASDEDIENAARIANCHDFIQKLPLGYSTSVGEGGAQLSGGQKQKIAIARAIVRNPKILLLDEATSALDARSETLVQKALDKVTKGRTTLIVAHRLSTIRNADKIVVLDGGVVAETGTHKQLTDLGGIYHNLRMTSSDSDNREGSGDYVNDDFLKDPQKNLKTVSQVSPKHSTSSNQKENIMKRILQVSLEDWKLFAVGSLGSILLGASFSLTGVFYNYVFRAFQENNIDNIYRIVITSSSLLLSLAVVAALAALIQYYMFGRAGARLTTHLRCKFFEATLKQKISWFDAPENSVGVLTTRLSTDCINVQSAVGPRLAGILQAATAFLAGFFIGLVLSWKLTLVVSIFVPLLVFVNMFDSQYSSSSAANERLAMEKASRIAVEAIASIRTVTSLNQQNYMLEKFSHELKVAEQEARKGYKFRGITFALNIGIYIFEFGVVFLYVFYLLINDNLDFVDAFIVVESILNGGFMIGAILNSMPNVSVAVASAERILDFLDDQGTVEKAEVPSNDTISSIEFKDVKFRYPTRAQVEVLRGMNLSVAQGKTLALVGSSGCGKSTCIQLLMRFYDPDEGRLEVDNKATVDISPQWIRSHLGIVSQEPVLFNRTIAENIAYGDNSREISIEEIIEVAKTAQIHSQFIINLPLGYDTPLGVGGTQLSGGQKQRIAIARALIRKPQILLLDEATSALDAESESVVQAALDGASKNRTCIVVAHRLSSIRNADLICVIDRGQIAEAGTHEELINYGGIYSKMYKHSP